MVNSYPSTLVKCPVCEERFNRNDVEFVPRSNRYYHVECFKKLDEVNVTQVNTTKPKKTTKEASEKVSKEPNEYQALVGYICALRGDDKPSLMILSQIKRYKEAGYTYNGIKMSLDYFHNIKGHPVMKDKGIGIVESVYEEAKRYFTKRYELMVENSKIEYVNETIVYKKKAKDLRDKHSASYVNLEEIEWN